MLLKKAIKIWEMLTGAPGALVKEAKVEAFALKIV
jgi:hypothetical protein